MELKKVSIKNKGMEQDLSISKSSLEYAFENHNIRIVSNDDYSSMSITNIQGPGKQDIGLNGTIIGKCILDKYIIIFTVLQTSNSSYGRIYRLDLKKDCFTLNTLYEGNDLNFDKDHLIETTYFIENYNCIKVYWVDGLNNPRVINIITEGERVELNKKFTPYTNSKLFDFYPKIESTPTILLEKTFEYQSKLTNGLVLYFISYSNNNGAETTLISSSAPITIGYKDRGAKEDEASGGCSIILKIDNIDTSFEYMRIYSAIRSAEKGEVLAKLVSEIKINNLTSVTVIDDGFNQETISFELLLFTGGLYLIAKTITQKDNTLFLGNLKKGSQKIPDSFYKHVNDNLLEHTNKNNEGSLEESIFSTNNVLIKSPFIKFERNKKIFTYNNSASPHYPYLRLTLSDFAKYKTFKGGEIYRFGIQFQFERGEWSEVIWIGDAECYERPKVNEDGSVELNLALFRNYDNNISLFPDNIQEALKLAGIINFRLMIADPEKHNGRKIKALGVLCPTLFNFKQRMSGIYGNASWVMRPRGSKISYHHLEPLVDYTTEGAEIVTNYTSEKYPNVTYKKADPPKLTYICITYIPHFEGSKQYIAYKFVEFTTNSLNTNMYNFEGSADVDVVREINGTTGDDFDLTGLANEITSKEIRDKIPVNAFKLLRDLYSKNIWISAMWGIAMLAVAVVGYFGLGPLIGVALAPVGILLTEGAMYALGASAIIGAAALGYFATDKSVSVTPNMNEHELKKLIDNYENLPLYTKEMLQRYCIEYPLPNSLKLDYISNIPLATRIENVFSDTQKMYATVYYENGKEKIAKEKTSTLPTVFKPDGAQDGTTVYFLLFQKLESDGIEKLLFSNNYFIDESLLTLHSPEIDENALLNSEYKCRIVGYTPLEYNNYFDAKIEVTPQPYGKLGGVNNILVLNRNNNIFEYNPFYSGELYQDLDATGKGVYTNYWCYLYGPGNIVGPHTQNASDKIYSKLVKKQILNHLYSYNTLYLENTKTYDANIKGFTEESLIIDGLKELPFGIPMYEGNHSNAYTVDMIHKGNDSEDNSTNEMISISFNSTPHAVVNFKSINNRIPLLPTLNQDDLYTSIKDNRVSGTDSWKKDALLYDRDLLWNYYLKNVNSNVVTIDFPFFIKNSLLTTTNKIFGLAINSFKNDKLLWSLYSNKNALVVNFLCNNVTEKNINKENLNSLSYWLSDKFIGKLNEAQLQLKDSEGNNYPLDNLCLGFGSILKESSWKTNYKDISLFILLCLYYYTGSYTYLGGTYPGIKPTFMLGLLFGFGQIGPTFREKDGIYKFFNIPEIVKINNKEQEFKNAYTECRSVFKEIFILACLYKYYKNNKHNSYLSHIQNRIQKCYSDFEKQLVEISYCLGENYDNNVYKAYVNFHVNKDKENYDEYGDLVKNLTPYSYCKTLNYDESLYYKGEEYPKTLNVLYNYSGYDGSALTNVSESIDFMKRCLTAIQKGVKSFISESYILNDGEYSISDFFNKEDLSTLKILSTNLSKIYSYNITEEGSIKLVDGYDNDRGILFDGYTFYTVQLDELIPLDNTSKDLYFQDYIELENPPKKPYLMMAELYTDIPYLNLYGGHTKEAIKKLTWYPISDSYNVYTTTSINNTYGDTVYLRWDCLKTYPSTEEDINQNVDITSFMVESRINLDERTDVNRSTFNIMSRPLNFNLFNNVYNNSNDLMLYNTILSEFNTDYYPNQFVWSLTKNYLGVVDTWTNISFAAVNQCKYPITKLCTYRDKILSFNTKSIEYIDFNIKQLINTDSGFIELLNNNKVLGTVDFSDLWGTTNSSIQITEKGLYFVEDNEGSIIRINLDGSTIKLGLGRMDTWMKDNIKQGTYNQDNTKAIHLEYDSLNKELYIINDTYCLVYNEIIESFTSFIDFLETMFMFVYNNHLWSFANEGINNYTLYKMYSGSYNTSYNDKVINYSLHYRVNPEVNSDKVFTNVDFIADIKNINNTITTLLPFDTIRVWNEYQDTGLLDLQFKKNYSTNLKQKFRIWNADIPRDSKSLYKRNRIRNPWINLYLSKKNTNTSNNNYKLELHNLNVQYMS